MARRSAPPAPDPAHPDRSLIMGVVNVTPDSFSDGGRYLDPEVAVAHGLRLLAEGADLLDVGGEATGPRSTPIDLEEELRRVLPVVERLAAAGATVSIDTTKAAVAEAAVARGARLVNDISGGRFDPAMREVLTRLPGVTYICGHLLGDSLPQVFAREAVPNEPGRSGWEQVARELRERLALLPAEVARRAWIDPGLGFGKRADLNVELVHHAGELGHALGHPVVVGPSRKRFLRHMLEAEGVAAPTEAELDAATVAACLVAIQDGPCVLRVHNVALLHTALTAYNKD